MANQQGTNEPDFCKLCGKHHHHMSTPVKWKNKKAQELAVTLNVTDEQLVCQPCRQDISKLLSSSNCTPRWEKNNNPKKCLVLGCASDQPIISSKTLDLTITKTVMENNRQKLLEPIPTTICLCKEHYNMVYKTAFPAQAKCITCGVSLKNSNPKLCPSPLLVEEHLKASTGFEGRIRENDKVLLLLITDHT